MFAQDPSPRQGLKLQEPPDSLGGPLCTSCLFTALSVLVSYSGPPRHAAGDREGQGHYWQGHPDPEVCAWTQREVKNFLGESSENRSPRSTKILIFFLSWTCKIKFQGFRGSIRTFWLMCLRLFYLSEWTSVFHFLFSLIGSIQDTALYVTCSSDASISCFRESFFKVNATK